MIAGTIARDSAVTFYGAEENRLSARMLFGGRRVRVAGASRTRGLSDEQMWQARGITENHGPRSQMMREIANPAMLHDGLVWGAMVAHGRIRIEQFIGSGLSNPVVARVLMEFATPSLGVGRAAAVRDAVLGLIEPGSIFSNLGALIYDAPDKSIRQD